MKSLFEQLGGSYMQFIVNKAIILFQILHFLRVKKPILVFMGNGI